MSSTDQGKPTDGHWLRKWEVLFWVLPCGPVVAALLLPPSPGTALIVLFYSLVWPVLLAIWSFALFARLFARQRSRTKARPDA